MYLSRGGQCSWYISSKAEAIAQVEIKLKISCLVEKDSQKFNIHISALLPKNQVIVISMHLFSSFF